MANLNKVLLMGNLTRDPELRYTPKGTAVADIALAINRVWNDDRGQKQEETTFVDVTLWGRQAELAQQYLAKGLGVYVEGRLQLDQWDDKASGQKRTKLKIVGESLQFLPSGAQRDNTAARPAGRSHDANKAHSGPTQSPDDIIGSEEDDDIPF